MRHRVEVWTCGLEGAAELAGRYLPLLSADEVERAARYKGPGLRDAFILGRGVTRTILARRLGGDPREISFSYSTYGKPSLPADRGVHFNVSHSHALLICGLTGAAPLGVDVERVRPMPDAANLAARFFSAAEAERIRSASPESVAPLFFDIWTRKEAFLKATGAGFSRSLGSFTVSSDPAELPRFERIAEPADDPAQWSLRSFVPAESYVGALALRAPVEEVTLHRFDPFASAG